MTLLLEYAQSRTSWARIVYNKKSRQVELDISNEADNSFYEWMSRVRQRLSNLVKEGHKPEDIIVRIKTEDNENGYPVKSIAYETRTASYTADFIVNEGVVYALAAKGDGYYPLPDSEEVQRAIQTLKDAAYL